MGTFVADDSVQATEPPNTTELPKVENRFIPDQDLIHQQARTNIYGAMNSNPEVAAKSLDISNRLGVPQPAVEQDHDTYAKLDKFHADNQTLDNSPKLKSWVANDPVNAKISNDDLHNLSGLEQTLTQPTPSNILTGIGHSFSLSAYRAYQGVLMQYADLTGDQSLLDQTKRNTQLANQVEQQDTPVFNSTLGKMTYGGFQGLTNAAPGIMAMAVNPLAGIGLFGAQAEAEGYGKYRSRGGTAKEAAIGGGAEGAVMAATSFLPLKYVTSSLGKVGLGEFFANLLGRDVASMEVQTIANTAIDTAVANPDKTIGDWAKELPENMGQAAISALIFSGTLGGIHGVARKLNTATTKADSASQDFDRLNIVSQLAEASKTKERDPEGFKNFINSVTEDGRLENVYVDGKVFNQSMEKAGITPEALQEQMPDVAKQINDATNRDGTIKIPTSDYATYIAGSDLDKAILPSLKTDPEGMTYSEAQDHYKTLSDQLKEQVKTLGEKQTVDDTWNTSVQNVHDQVLQTLNEVGRFPDSVNREYARVKTAAIEQLAKRLNLTPEDAYAKYGNSVVGEENYSNGKNFNQEDALYNRALVIAREKGSTSVESIKRSLNIQQGRAEELVKQMEADGYITPSEDTYNVGKETVETSKGSLGQYDVTDKMNTANLLYQNKPTFYSQLRKSIDTAPDKVFSSGEQTAKWLEANQGKLGIKKDEIYWTGINDWLKTQDKVSKEDVQAFLDGNGVQVKEVELGGKTPQPYLTINNGKYQVNLEGGKIYGEYSDAKDAHDAMNRAIKDSKKSTKFEPYQLPGGENYKELLLTLPPALPAYELRSIAQLKDFLSKNERMEKSLDGLSDVEKFKRVNAELKKQGIKPEFKSPHYEQPNILAHIRFNERTDAEGKKVLFLEEIQSDWGQKGKKEGFKSAKELTFAKDKAAQFDAEMIAKYGSKSAMRDNMTDDEIDARTKLYAAAKAEEKTNYSGIQSAPFVTDTKSWTSLAMKRMIAYAADNGFDKIAWTTGEQQTERYDLSKQISRVEYFPENKTLRAFDLNGNRALEETVEPNNIEDYVGKDVAKKLLESETVTTGAGHQKHSIEGDGLKVGGEGMKGYYDKIVPQVASKIIEKTGGKVENVNIGDSESAKYSVVLPNGKEVHTTDNLKNAEAVAKDFDGAKVQENSQSLAQQGFTITPEMKTKVQNEGQALFQNKSNVHRGFYEPEQRMIGLLKDADLSTYIHETGHYLFDVYSKIANEANAPAEIKGDVDKLLSHLKIEGQTPEERLAKWHSMSLEEQRPLHEEMARLIENYFLEGKAPSVQLQPVFARIKTWMMQVYKHVQELGVNLSPEVKNVFDRMFASEEAIKEAEAQRSYFPIVKEKPEGVSDKTWNDYQQQGKDATQSGIDEMQSKSIKDMKWMSNAKSNAMREQQKEANKLRAGIRDEASKEVDKNPLYKAERWLRTGETTDEKGNLIGLSDEAKKGAKLNTDEVKRLYPETSLSRPDLDKLSGMTSPHGMPPDLVAEMFGFNSADALIRSLTDMPSRAEAIEHLTDQKMLQQHGELATPDAIERAAEAAIHNDVRAKFMATGLKILTKSEIPARQLVKAAREAADGIIADLKVGEINPKIYMADEAKANKEVLKLAPKDPEGAIQAQRSALLNNQLAKSALEAKTDTDKILKYLKRFDKKTIMDKMDVDVRDQVTDLLERFDLRQKPTTGPTKQQEQLQQWMDSQRDYGYSPNFDASLLNPNFKTHYKEMTVDQFKGLADTIKSIEFIGRERKSVTIDGQKMAVLDVVNQLKEKMAERGEKFTDAQLVDPPRLGVDPILNVALDRVSSTIRAAWAEDDVQHFKANRYDMHQILGPFHKYIFERVFAANYKYLDMRRATSNSFRDTAKELGKEWQKSLNDVIENHNLMDNSLDVPVKRRLTREDLLGIMVHIGNESNFDKLAKGMQWKPEDIWQAVHDNATENDFKAVRKLGEEAGKNWPEAVEMNKRLGNTSPEKIEPRPFMTKFGEMPGWYAPIKYDPIRSRLGKNLSSRSEINPNEGLFGSNYFRKDTTTNGSMNSRVAYNDFIDLNLSSIEKAINDGNRDLAYREAMIDVHKLVAHPDFRNQFEKTYGPEDYKALDRWLGRLVNSENMDEKQSKWVAWSAATRKAVVANGIAFRISTMEKHGGAAALKTMGYFAGGGERYILSRLGKIGTNHNAEVVEALAKFPEIRARAEQQDRDMSQGVQSMINPESIHGKAERFGHAGVAFFDFLTAVPTANAAYDWATTDGIPKRLGGTGEPMSHEDAVKFASGIVREAHGTNIESDRSLLMGTKSEFIKNLTILHTFMNNSMGQVRDMYDKGFNTDFGKPELAARFMMATIVPGIAAGAAGTGLWKEGESAWAWLAESVGSELAGGLPMVREAYSYLSGHSSAGLPPWMNALVSVSKAGKSIAKGSQGEEVKHPIKDFGNAAGLFLPGLGQAGSTTQFLYDEYTGKETAQTVSDWLSGISHGEVKR